MRKAIKFQIINAFNSTGFLRVCLIGVVFSIFCFIINCISSYNADIISVQASYMQFLANSDWQTLIFGMVMPLLACAAYSDSYLADYNNNYFPICAVRMGAKKYYFSKLIAVFFCGAFVIFLPQIINYLLCMIAFPFESTNQYTLGLIQADTYGVILDLILFKRLYIFSPHLYFLLYIFISSLIAGAIAVIAYQLSYFVKNKIFVLSIMFIFINLFSVFCDVRNIKLDVLDCIFGLDISTPSYPYFIIIIASYFLMAFAPIPFALKKVKNTI
ncbi:MAG: hypothetical protein J1E05_01300 [Eubacterium sp.]|nr:hypothetical protein [Eubacterium sp.]